MGQGELQAALTQTDQAVWRSSDCGEASVNWLPLVPISETGLWLGICHEGVWILGRLQGIVASSPRDKPLPQAWLPVLDISEPDFLERLDFAAREHGLPANELRRMLPVDDILMLGLRSRSEHWAECAMRWLIGRPVRDDQISLLHEIAASRWANQWTRQTAKKLLSASPE